MKDGLCKDTGRPLESSKAEPNLDNKQLESYHDTYIEFTVHYR